MQNFKYYKVKLPPYSPDINIIELVWAELKRFLRKRMLTTKQEVVDRAQLFFDRNLTLEKCRNYIRRVNTVLQIIIEKNGDWSDC